MEELARLREQLSEKLQSLCSSSSSSSSSAREVLRKGVNHMSFVGGSGYAPFEDVLASSSFGETNYNAIFNAQNKRYAQELLTEGFERSKAGDDASAVTLFTEALSFCPDEADVYCCRGCVYANRKEYSKAIDDFYKCLSIDKDHIDAQECLGRTLERGGFLGGASQAALNAVAGGVDDSSKRGRSSSSSSRSSSSSSSDSSAERRRRRRKKRRKRRKRHKREKRRKSGGGSGSSSEEL